jgi:uncharacterized membrane protein
MTVATNWISRIDARHRFFFSAAAAIAVFLLLRHRVHSSTVVIASWDVFALCLLALAWCTIITTPPDRLRARARRQDSSRGAIFIFVVVAACAGLFAIGFLLHTRKGEAETRLTAHLLLTLIAVVSSWCVVHTVFGLRYAHTFYGDDPLGDQHARGLEFPGQKNPDYLDFAYFSFVIGMTCQVSDVQVISRVMRQIALMHGVLSFGFNTVILALTINTASTLL